MPGKILSFLIRAWRVLLLGTLVMVLGFVQCSKPDTDSIAYRYDYNYFPVDSGNWRVYKVVQITVDSISNLYDTLKYELKEINSGYYTDAANDSMIKIDRFIRATSDQLWSPVSIWTAGIIDHKAIQIENNNKFVKINFPVSLNKTWDGDAFNRLDTLKQYQYTITSVDEPEVINSNAFDLVLVVTQKNDLSAVDELFFEERYAYGVGLVEKTQIDIYSEYDPRPIEQRVTKGTFYYQKISSYGKN